MREITTHQINPCNKAISVFACDGPGHGGASHQYAINFYDRKGDTQGILINFQNGPVNENGKGINGLTHEALLAVLIDRLEGFRAGPYANEDNAQAMSYLHVALGCLNARTRRREAAGIEGTMALDPVPVHGPDWSQLPRQESARDGRLPPPT